MISHLVKLLDMDGTGEIKYPYRTKTTTETVMTDSKRRNGNYENCAYTAV